MPQSAVSIKFEFLFQEKDGAEQFDLGDRVSIG
jgi:hypothetical protein